MKKILIATGIFPPEIGGPATYAKLLADHWGADADVLTYSRTLRRIPKPFRQIIYFLKALRLAGRADVVFALSTLGVGVSAALAARWRGKPLVVRVAGDRAWEDAIQAKKTHLLIDDFQHAEKRGFKHSIQVWVCRQSKAVIVPSKYLAQLVSGWGIPRENIHVVPNAFPSNSGTSPIKEVIRKELGIAGNIIVSVGRMVPWKGFRMLIKLMPQFLEINPFFRLVIVGDGPDMKLLKTIVQNLHLENKVYLVGRKSNEETARYVSASDLFILNTGYEGFSHQLLATMNAGVPVITTSVGGNRELITQGENGFMVKYNDEFNILEAVKTLWASPELRAKFSIAGKKTASHYSPDRTIRETEVVLTLL